MFCCSHDNVCTHLSLTLGLCPYTSLTNEEEAYVVSGLERKRENQAPNVSRRNWGYSTELMLFDDPWKIKKVLTESDISNMSRLLLGKELVKKLVLPVLGVDDVDNNGGIQVRIWDVDTHSMHSLIFKKWVTSQSYVFMGTWRKDFVIRRGLKEGDEIGFHWDAYNKYFNFSLLQVADEED